MRFDDLFDDLESQLEAELGAHERDTLAEEERFRVGRLELVERLRAAPRSLDLRLRSGERLRIERLAVGRDWLSGTIRDVGGDGAGCIVPMRSIAGVRLDDDAVTRSLASAPAPHGAPPPLAARLSLGFALRDLSRRRAAVEVRCPAPLHGTIDRVARDHLDLAIHEAGTTRHPRHVVGVELVPFAAIDWVRLP
ncbi:hypothetical protein [Agrococcus sp. SGAir0287]|uniref:hypothetical protein n=1 Tax=Agrococcus sp. SGAir0287 TaxID=2070347 RepID=UPI0010CCF725|nr:hypothetical protein [Agrococcus sp. SGAir0287]QCR18734.1 hypothetical protein C1N71_04100 [Agrococcus sp. SGAir0287]